MLIPPYDIAALELREIYAAPDILRALLESPFALSSTPKRGLDPSYIPAFDG
jgi:hypothetical protein